MLSTWAGGSTDYVRDRNSSTSWCNLRSESCGSSNGRSARRVPRDSLDWLTTTHATVSDEILLERWANHDSKAGATLVERHFDTVYRFFVRRAPQTTADLVQRTFLACIEARSHVSQVDSFRAFLLGMAHRQLRHHFQQTRTGQEALANLSPADAPATSPTSYVSLCQEQRRLLHALRHLPLELQLTLELYYWEELTTKEISDVVGVAQGTVMNRLFRARRQLKCYLVKTTRDPALLASTRTNLESWAQSLRRVHAREGSITDRDSAQ